MQESEAIMSMLAELRKASGDSYISLSKSFNWHSSGTTCTSYHAYRGDTFKTYRGATAEESISNAIKEIEQ